MDLKFNKSILIILVFINVTLASLPLSLYHHNYHPQVLYPTHGHDQSVYLAHHKLETVPSTTTTAVITEKPPSKNLLVQIFKLLWNRRFGKHVETTTEKEIPEPVIIQQPVPFYLPQPYPVTRTLIKEVPVIQKEYVPIKVPVHEKVLIPHQTLIQQHEIQPVLTQVIQPTITKVVEPTETKISEPTTPKSIDTTTTPEPESSSSPATTTEAEKEKDVNIETEVIESEKIMTPPPSLPELEYGLPSMTPNQPFNEYGPPLQESDKYQMFNENTITNYGDNMPIPISGNSGEGEYHNSYVLNDGTRVTEEGKLVKGKMGNDVLIKKGNYEFFDEQGKIIKVDWVADELGFRILEN